MEADRGSEPDRLPNPDLVEYLVLTISSLSSGTSVAAVLRSLIETAQIRLLDLVGVQTDSLSRYRTVESHLLPGLAGILARDGDAVGILSEDDIALVCGALGPNVSALILVAEDRWAQPLAEAARVGGGRVVGGERIPRRSIAQSQRRRPQRVDLLRRRPLLGDSLVQLRPHGF
jgi:hypothetical protein